MRGAGWMFLALLLAASAAGCNARVGRRIETKAYRGVEQGALLAFAWGGAPGFEDDEASPVIVLFEAEPADRKQRLASCDPKTSECKRLDDFADTGLEPDWNDDSLLGRFATGDMKQDLLFLVVTERGTQLVTSDVIAATAASRPSGFSPGELRFDRNTQQLAWPRVPDNALYVVTLSDDVSHRPLTAIATRRKSWTYPELQGIVQYLHDPANVGEVRAGGRYVAVLYSVNKQGWANLIANAVVKP